MLWNLTKNISGVCKSYNRSAPDIDSIASYLLASYHCLLILILGFDPALSVVPLNESNVTWMKYLPVMLFRVFSVSSSLDVKKAIGPDGVRPHILRHCANELCYPVCLLFYQVYNTGVFPLSWKVSHITPVYKRKVLSLTNDFIAQLLSFYTVCDI